MQTTNPFGAIYFCDDGKYHSAAFILAGDHWEACERAWEAIPVGAADFQIVEDMAEAGAFMRSQVSMLEAA